MYVYQLLVRAIKGYGTRCARREPVNVACPGFGKPPLLRPAVPAKLHQYVHVVRVLEAPLELDQKPVTDLPVDSDFREDLLPRAVFFKRGLRHDLRRETLARRRVVHGVHHGEPAFP